MAKINRRDLVNELKKVVQILPRTTSTEIFQYVLVKIKDNKVKISGTNGITSVVTSLFYDGGMIEEELNFIVEGKLFHNIINKMSSDEVDLSIKDKDLQIKGGKSNFNIVIIDDLKQFPNIANSFKNETSFTIKSDMLRDIVKKTIGFVSDDEARPVLSAVKLEFGENNISGVSTDGFRLSHTVETIEIEKEGSLIIRGEDLSYVVRALDKESIEIQYSSTSDEAGFIIGDTSVYVKQLEDTFLKYKEILKPNDAKVSMKVNLNDFRDAIERVSIMAKDNNKFLPLSLSFKDNNIIVATKSEVGDVVETISIGEMEGESIEQIAFNPKYVLEGLKVCTSEDIELKFTTPLNPGYIVETDSKFTYLMLPIRINNAA